MKPKISVIMWDGNFREYTHTIDYFGRQDLPRDQYELLWVDFYNSNDRIRDKLAEYENARLITLGHEPDVPWHSAVMINTAVREAAGDLIVIPDGDIVAEKHLLEYTARQHTKVDELVMYFRRFDELEADSRPDSRQNVQHLIDRCKLISPTNYYGCFTIKKKHFLQVDGFEEHPVFSYGGDNGVETYIRLRNSGLAVKWSNDMNIYHPWHPGYGTTTNTAKDRERARLRALKTTHDWISPYGGLEQSWIIRCRTLNLDTKADGRQCDEYLSRLPKNLKAVPVTPVKKSSLFNLFSSAKKS